MKRKSLGIMMLALAGCNAYGSNLAPWITDIFEAEDALVAPASLMTCSALLETEVDILHDNLQGAWNADVSYDGAIEGAARVCPYSAAPQQCETCVEQLADEIYLP